jgi:hypothetical protein
MTAACPTAPWSDRPAAPAAVIDARWIDMVVVYQIDRLTRSGRLGPAVERFDAAGCSFVSVAFNTATDA